MKRTLFAIASVLALQPSASAQDAPPPAVEVVAVGTPATLGAMADRVRALESRLAVAVHWSAAESIDVREVVAPRDAGDGVFARVWIDLSNPERAVLFIANAGHDRFLVRVIPVSDGYGELTRESLATVVESAIDALLSGGQIGVDRSAAMREIEAQTGTPIATEPPTPAPVVAAELEPEPAEVAPRLQPVSRPASLLIGAGYRVDAIASGPAIRHGAQLAVAWTGGGDAALDLLLAVTGQYFPRFELGDAGRRVAEHGGGARIAVGAAGHLTRDFAWQAALGAGVDVLRIEPVIGEDTGLEAAQPFSVTAPVATTFVTGAWRPTRWFELNLSVGLDVALSGPHFDVESGTGRTHAVSPWRFHPYGLVGIGMPFEIGAMGAKR